MLVWCVLQHVVYWLVPPSGWKWAPESHHGCHTDHQAAWGDHRRVWEAEDPGHQGPLHRAQIKNHDFNSWNICLLKQWVAVKWNQTVMIWTVFFCSHLPTHFNPPSVFQLFVFGHFRTYSCLVGSCDSFEWFRSLLSTDIYPYISLCRKSLASLWQWRCPSMPRPWRCTPWPSRAFKVWMKSRTWRWAHALFNSSPVIIISLQRKCEFRCYYCPYKIITVLLTEKRDL